MNVRGFDLTYCSNIHAGESWDEVRRALGDALPSIRRQLDATGPFGIGLRLSARALEQLQQPQPLEEFFTFLHDGDYYVPTINGFPFGALHGQQVKEQAYLPDWRVPARLKYSNMLASLLAELLKKRGLNRGSVSTIPGAFKGHMRSQDDTGQIAVNLLEHARHLARLRDATGVTVTLALEPEPACFIETSAEAIEFFETYLFDERLAYECGVTVDQIRRHIGICFDACHVAIEFEDPAAALAAFDRAGISVPKFQISSALRVTDALGRDALKRFADETYLHQVVERSNGSLTRYVDLPDAPDLADGAEWRVHFHVPIFLRSLGALETTQPDLERVLDLVKTRKDRPCVEVETYTWNVLPAQYRTTEISEAIARELKWTRDRLEAAGSSSR
jgi:hypothetical protein